MQISGAKYTAFSMCVLTGTSIFHFRLCSEVWFNRNERFVSGASSLCALLLIRTLLYIFALA